MIHIQKCMFLSEIGNFSSPLKATLTILRKSPLFDVMLSAFDDDLHTRRPLAVFKMILHPCETILIMISLL